MNEIKPSNFIEQAIVEDIEKKHLKKIITRFPPEPTGYLHIGHAKAVCIDFLTAQKFGGITNLRFDDTNPNKEKEEYAESIKQDIKWLGFKWNKCAYVSDYYEKIYETAVDFIKQGLAYVCDLSAEEISATRGTLTTPGTNSPYRNRSIEENLDLFARMRAGEFKDGEKVLRAKIDMASPNINMRDPVIYRILHTSHFRTGDKWCIYPMYDFAHPLEDAIENITHSLCSLEFEDHRPLYDWVIEHCRTIAGKPRQIEFARLNIDGTVMSKRFLNTLVNSGYVDGWDDPRLPTVRALRRKGYPASSVREFCTRIGVSKSNSLVQPHILEACVREDLNKTAQRVMAVVNPLKVVITNYAEKKTEKVNISNNPTVENSGHHTAIFARELYIEKEDFMEEPAPKFFRLYPGNVVRLMGCYIIRCDKVVKNDAGEIDHLECSIVADGSAKPKATIHWVSVVDSLPMTTYHFNNLLNIGETFDPDRLAEIVNPNSREVRHGFIEKFATKVKADKQMQFVRMGYYILDTKADKKNLIYNETVSLKDSK